MNRRLFMALEKKEIDGGTYNMLERGEVAGKLLFLFKEQSAAASAEISALRRVFTLRNEAVHVKAKANPVRLSFEELLRQLRAVSWLCDRVEGDPKGADIDAFAAEYARCWLV